MRSAVVAVALLVVLAGCSAGVTPPGVTPTSTTNPTQQGSITVTNGTLPVDPNGLFSDVTTMLAVDAQPPARIELEPDDQMGIVKDPMPPFYRLVGIERPPGSSRAATALGYVADPSAVHLNDKLLGDQRQLQLTLVHEYVHVVQSKTGEMGQLDRSIPDPNTTDATIVRRSILEGAAVTVETTYWRRHFDSGTSPAQGMAGSYAATEGARQWVYAPYYFGYDYVTARTNSTTEIAGLYRSPPHTTEELIHGRPGGSEPQPPLQVGVDSSNWTVNGTDREGELFVRVALDTELSSDRAATAAAGWGTDQRVTVENGDRRGYVWALRWDDAANATEFEDAIHAYLDDRATRTDGIWTDGSAAFDETRVGPQTVVLTLGNESFVRSATVDGTDGSVSVRT